MNAFPAIAWNNLLRQVPGPAVTHSADAAGFPFANLFDWRDYTFWKSSETGELVIKLDADPMPGDVMTIDTFALAGHNLGSAGVSGLSFASSDDDIDYTACFAPVTPADDCVIFRKFAARTQRYFKLTIPSGYTGAPRIGIFFAGESMEIPCYPDPGFDPDAREVESSAEYGKTGRILGVAESFRRREIRADFARLDPGFIEQKWLPFFRDHVPLPFFFAWAPLEKPEQACLARLSSPRIDAPYQGPWRSLALTMTATQE